MSKKITEAVTEKLPKERSVSMSEIGEGEPVEVMSDHDIGRVAEQEKFSNDILTIRVHPDNAEGSLPVICPSVNGLNQPIIRGVESKIKRKYVEALARCRTTKYEQEETNPTRPENIQMRETTIVSYPFAVLHDPHPHGREWLDLILAQA